MSDKNNTNANELANEIIKRIFDPNYKYDHSFDKEVSDFMKKVCEKRK